MPSLEAHKILIQAMKEQGVRQLVEWEIPGVRSGQDKKSLITVVPGLLAGLAFPQAKRNGGNWGTAPNVGIGWDAGLFCSSKKYLLYRQGKSRVWGYKHEVWYFQERYRCVHSGTAGQQPLYWQDAYH